MTLPGSTLLPGRALFPGDATGQPMLVTILDESSNPPSIQLAISWPSASRATVTRRDPDGQRWPVRQADPALLDDDGNWVGIDFEAAYGVPVSYDLTSQDFPGVIVHIDAGMLTAPVRWQMALVHPGAPALSVPVQFYTGTRDTVTRSITQSKNVVLGRRRPVVLSDVRQSASGQLVIWCDDLSTRDQLMGVLSDGQTLKVACDPSQGFDVPQTYVSLADVSEARWIPDYGPNDARIVTLPFTEVDRPAGGFQSVWDCAAVLAQYPTVVKLELAFPTCADLVLGRNTLDASAWINLTVLDSYATCSDVLGSFSTCKSLLAGTTV